MEAVSFFWGPSWALLQPDDLGRAAADVEYQCAAIASADQGRATFGGQVGFLFRRDHLEVEARLVTGAPDQRVGICGQARCLGGDDAHAGHAMLGNPLRTDFQRGDGAVEGGIRQKPALAHPLAQPHDAGEGIHHAESPPGGRGGDQQAAIVGA